jgi:hypothetical protein
MKNFTKKRNEIRRQIWIPAQQHAIIKQAAKRDRRQVEAVAEEVIAAGLKVKRMGGAGPESASVATPGSAPSVN